MQRLTFTVRKGLRHWKTVDAVYNETILDKFGISRRYIEAFNPQNKLYTLYRSILRDQGD